jgi:hypothetical protein
MKTVLGMAAWMVLASSAMAQNTALTAAHLDAALKVQVGTLPCELGQTVVLEADPAAIGFFNLRIGKLRYRMAPELTTTGAVRLEDKSAGMVWLQLANKSMLMNQKQGRRMADECKSAVQLQVAEELRRNPQASVLDDATSTAVVKK